MTAGAHSMISDLKEAVLAAQNCSLAGMKAGQEIAERAAANRIKALEIRLVRNDQCLRKRSRAMP